MVRGRKPLPTEVKRARGTLQNCRVNPDEPRIEPAVPEALPGLDAMEQRHFDRLVEGLLRSRIVTAIDGGGLTSLAIAECRMMRAKRKLGSGRKTVTDDGKISAWSTELHRAQQIHRQLLVEYGLTPSARTRVSTTGKKPAAQSKRDVARERFFGGGAS